MPLGKITILKRLVDRELIERYGHQTSAPCPRFDTGQVFEVTEWGSEAPDGFCEWAWTDLQAKIAFAGQVEGPVLACCTDPFRTVVFEIERT